MSPTIGADVSEDFRDRIDERRETDESRSACVRRLLREALDDSSPDRSTAIWLSILGQTLYYVTYYRVGLEPAANVALVSLLAVTAWGAWPSITEKYENWRDTDD